MHNGVIPTLPTDAPLLAHFDDNENVQVTLVSQEGTTALVCFPGGDPSTSPRLDLTQVSHSLKQRTFTLYAPLLVNGSLKYQTFGKGDVVLIRWHRGRKYYAGQILQTDASAIRVVLATEGAPPPVYSINLQSCLDQQGNRIAEIYVGLLKAKTADSGADARTLVPDDEGEDPGASQVGMDSIAAAPPDELFAREAHWTQLKISARIISWPKRCACCFSVTDTTLSVVHTRTWGKRVRHSESRGWKIPYCDSCIRHAHAHHISTVTRFLGWFLAVAAGLIAVSAKEEPQVLIPCLIIGVLLVMVCFSISLTHSAATKSSLTSGCCSREQSARFLGWDGTVQTFEFARPDYVALLRSANPGKCLD